MIILRPLTIVFGALPATWLCIWAVVGMVFGLSLVVEGASSFDIEMLAGGFLLLGWGYLGLYGTVSLWAVGIGFTGIRWRLGLLLGIIAVSPLFVAGLIFGDLSLSTIPVFLPPIVACLWLIELHGRPEPPYSDKEFEEDLAELSSRGTSW